MFIWLGMSKQWCWKWDKLCETQVCETQLWVSLPLPPCRLLLQFPAKFKLPCFPSFSSFHTLSLSDLKTIQTAERQHYVSICTLKFAHSWVLSSETYKRRKLNEIILSESILSNSRKISAAKEFILSSLPCVGIPRIVCSPQIVTRVHHKLLTSLCRSPPP